jgi:hypothetical protein
MRAGLGLALLAVVSDDYDSAWKEVLEVYFEAFLAFFFPEAHAGIDWTRGHEFLDEELQHVAREAELGRRIVDKLVRVCRVDGEESWVLVHIEVQGQRDARFAERMYVYNYRLHDRYGRKVASLAVLADDQPGWSPSSFGYSLWGCEVSLRVPAVKLLDFAGRRAELEKSASPFAVVVMAHLEAQRTRRYRDGRRRMRGKLALVRELHRRGYGETDVRQLFRFIDWRMALPDELQPEFQTELRVLEEETKMPYITGSGGSGAGRLDPRRDTDRCVLEGGYCEEDWNTNGTDTSAVPPSGGGKRQRLA